MLQGRCCPRPAFAVFSVRAASGTVDACLLHVVLGSGLHFGAVGRPWPSRLSDRDSGRCEDQSANTGVSTRLRLPLDVPNELGCLPLRFGHARFISESVRPRRVVRIASSRPKSGWGRGADPRVGPAERRLGGGASIVQLRAESIMVIAPSRCRAGQPRASRRLRGPGGVLGWPEAPVCVLSGRQCVRER